MFTQYEGKWNEEINVCGIPFKVFRNKETELIDMIEMPNHHGSEIPFEGKCEALFFLGMSVTQWYCSDWWGKKEVEYNHSERVFVGSRMAHGKVVYTDNSEDYFELIFGVNCWSYKLFCKPNEKEKWPWGAPYDEPFKSDPAAKALLDASLKLMENPSDDYEMGNKWVFGLRTNPKKTVHHLKFCHFKIKNERIFISGITGVNAGETLDPAWKTMCQQDFISRSWFNDADRLMHRLYTFADCIPDRVPLEEIEDFDAPDIRFAGSSSASIYTNVYRKNIMDMAKNKISEDGSMHTSSLNTYNFGDYYGMGTFKAAESYYYELVSRDVGRTLTELVNVGYTERQKKSVELLEKYLYEYLGDTCPVPHWRRVANRKPNEYGMGVGEDAWENDGHGSLMMFIYSMYNKGVLGVDWINEHKKMLIDAGEYVMWQLENPEKSHYDKVLYSYSEASDMCYGGYDLFSNILVAAGLDGFARMMDAAGDKDIAERFKKGSEMIRLGVDQVFTMKHPRYGEIFVDAFNGLWTYDYKRFCDTFMHSDLDGYDMASDKPQLYEKLVRTFEAQVDEGYYNPFSGGQMGYGQGYLTVAAIMLDRYDEFTDCMDAIAGECYHAYDHNYIVPEGVIHHGSGRYWFRQHDLGNGVQQAETVKCTRLLLGIDDVNYKRGVRLIPRLPLNWSSMDAKDFPVRTKDGVKKIAFRYERVTELPDYCTVFACDESDAYAATWSEDMDVSYIRMGPFATEDVEVTGGTIQKVEKLGDWWFAQVVPC